MTNNDSPTSVNDSHSETQSKIKVAQKGSKVLHPILKEPALLIPNLITITGIFCGFLGIVYAISENFNFAARYILVAAIMDFLDGRVARRLNATSAFGKELDSLADVIAFGVAPAILVYTWGFQSHIEPIGIFISFIYIACGATRLARFNITADKDSAPKGFVGLPIPGAAAAIVSIALAHPEKIASLTLHYSLMVYTLFIAILMITKINYPSLKHVRVDSIDYRILLLISSIGIVACWYNFQISRINVLLHRLQMLSNPLRYYGVVKNYPYL